MAKRRIPKYRRDAAKNADMAAGADAAGEGKDGTRIAADVSKQAPNNSYSPPLFYDDLEFTCRDCGKV